jgi:hypothetical protein
MSRWTNPHVYVIGAANRGPVKIGISECPEGRLCDLQTGNPEILVVLGKFPDGEEDETELHKLFAAERLQGEWFKRTSRIRNFIDMINCKVAPVTAMAACRPAKGNTTRAARAAVATGAAAKGACARASPWARHSDKIKKRWKRGPTVQRSRTPD